MHIRYSLALALIAAPLMLAGCKEKKPEAEQPPMPVKFSLPVQKTLSEWDEFSGRFRARKRVEVRARVSGYVDSVRFTDGQMVRQGQVLYVIDQRPFRIAYEKADAAYELAKKEYERSRLLRRSRAVSQEELDQRYQMLRDAKAQLADAKLNLEFTMVTAPIAGRASRHLVDVGNLVGGGENGATVLTTIVSLDPIDFYFEANEQDLLKYTRLAEEGKRESSRTAKRPLFVKLQDESDYVHEGTIDFVDNEIDRETGTIQARAVFPNPKGELTPGVFGRGRMAGSGEYLAMLVPDSIINTNQTQKFVYVVNAENMLEPRNVTLGPLYDGGLRIVREGLKADDRVVVSGTQMVRPGMKVDPQPTDAIPPSPNDPIPSDAAPKEGPTAEQPAADGKQ